jgi:RND superfamily putative drug exporter
VLPVWIVVLVLVSVLANSIGANFQDKFSSGNSEAGKAQTLLEEHFPQRAGASADVVFRTAAPIDSPRSKEQIAAVVQRLRTLGHPVGAVTGPFDADAAGQVSAKGHIAYASVQFDTKVEDLKKADVQRVVDTAQDAAAPGFEVELGGQAISIVAQATPGAAESIGILAAIIILLIAFGSVIAMGLPILTALCGIGIAFGFVDLISRAAVVPSFGPQLAAMIGIGVGIDYALFVVTRYREALHDGHEPRDAVILSLVTSGRAVVFAGTTVIISLLGMLLLGVSFVYGLAFSSIVAVLIVLLATLTLLPALLGFAGHAIDKLGVPHRKRSQAGAAAHSTLSFRWSRQVQRHPVVIGCAALAALVALSLPLFSMHQAFSDAGNDPSSLTTRKAYDLLAEGFGPGTNGPLVLAVEVPSGQQGAVAALGQALGVGPPGTSKVDDVALVTRPQFNEAGDTARIVVIPQSSPQSKATESLVHRLRDHVVPEAIAGTGLTVHVGGFTAGGIDATAQMSGRLLWVIGGVVLLSFLLLMAVFRSVAIPVKAAVMNLLSIGSAYGVIVAVFQWGWLGSVVGIGKTGPIDPWIPLMMFTILFGLSMDYEVFLLSRIREEWLRTGENARAVADGLAGTARVITAAAAIMVCVFGSFVIGDLRVLKLFGLGLATAIFIDATLVRMLLVPATMELLGNANWWFPRWLDRLLPTLSAEVTMEAAGVAPAVGEGGSGTTDEVPVGVGDT